MTAAERQTRYQQRKNLDRTARALGWNASDAEALYVTPQGTTVALALDGSRVPLTLDPDFDDIGQPASSVGSLSAPRKKKKVWAPKNWDKDLWNNVRNQSIEKKLTRERVIKNLYGFLESGKLDSEQVRKAVAVIEALPDTPDWYEGLPIAEEDEK